MLEPYLVNIKQRITMFGHKLIFSALICTLFTAPMFSAAPLDPSDTRNVVFGVYGTTTEIEVPSEVKASPLHHAAYLGDVVKIQELINNGVDKDAQLPGGIFDSLTALHLAALRNKADAIIALLNAGANPNVKTYCPNFPHDSSPLIIAIFEGAEVAVITALLNAGADPNARFNAPSGSYYHGHTALHIAVSIWFLDAVEALLRGGANPNSIVICPITGPQTDYWGCTPLHIAISHPFHASTPTVMEFIIQLLLKAGANKNALVDIPGAYYYGFSPLHFAVQGIDSTHWGHPIRNLVAAAQVLIAEGATIDPALLEKIYKCGIIEKPKS